MNPLSRKALVYGPFALAKLAVLAAFAIPLTLPGVLQAAPIPFANTPAKPKPTRQEADALKACVASALTGFRPIATYRDKRFEGKVSAANALCRGGQKAVQFRLSPWVDWSNYWGTGDMSSLPSGFLTTKGPEFRGVTGALLDLEFQRIELIKFTSSTTPALIRTSSQAAPTLAVLLSRPGPPCGYPVLIPTTPQ